MCPNSVRGPPANVDYGLGVTAACRCRRAIGASCGARVRRNAPKAREKSKTLGSKLAVMLPIRRIGTAVAVSVVVSAPAAARGQQPTLDPQRAVALVVTYADGRRAPLIVGTTTGGATTSTFPREPSWTPPANQLSVDAIKFECLRTTEGVRVAISVFRGSQRQQDEPIKTMLVTPAQSVTVDAELRAVGVQPVTVSVMPIVVPELRAPEVTVPSPQVEVAGVRVTTTPFSGYVITLRNRSTKAVRSIEIAPMVGGRVGQTTRRAGREGQALIVPGTTYQIIWQLSVGLSASGGVAPISLDQMLITTVRWADGTYEGDAATAAYDDVFDKGTKAQLAAVVAALERAQVSGQAATPAGLRDVLSGLPVTASNAMVEEARAIAGSLSPAQIMRAIELALQQVKTNVLADLAEFESGRATLGVFQGWINTEHDRYQRWLERLSSQQRPEPGGARCWRPLDFRGD